MNFASIILSALAPSVDALGVSVFGEGPGVLDGVEGFGFSSFRIFASLSLMIVGIPTDT